MGDALNSARNFVGGAARGVPGWAEAAFLPVGATVEALKAVTPEQAPDAPTPTPPPVAQDPTDDLVRRARLAAAARAQSGQGMDSTFLTGPLGLQNPPLGRTGT